MHVTSDGLIGHIKWRKNLLDDLDSHVVTKSINFDLVFVFKILGIIMAVFCPEGCGVKYYLIDILAPLLLVINQGNFHFAEMEATLKDWISLRIVSFAKVMKESIWIAADSTFNQFLHHRLFVDIFQFLVQSILKIVFIELLIIRPYWCQIWSSCTCCSTNPTKSWTNIT